MRLHDGAEARISLYRIPASLASEATSKHRGRWRVGGLSVGYGQHEAALDYSHSHRRELDRMDRRGARSRSAVADTGARLGEYPAPGVEEYRQEKSVASRGRGDLLSVAGGGPRFSRAGFSLRSGRGPSGCGE